MGDIWAFNRAVREAVKRINANKSAYMHYSLTVTCNVERPTSLCSRYRICASLAS